MPTHLAATLSKPLRPVSFQLALSGFTPLMRTKIRALLDAAADGIADTPSSALPAIAIDFETFYRSDSKAKRLNLEPCNVDHYGNWRYCRRHEWEAYLVAFYSPASPIHGLAELAYVGPPREAPWRALAGRTWVSHNRNFDRHAYEFLVEHGKLPDVRYSAWYDTADLAAWSHQPRSLAAICEHHFDLILDKEAREDMDGVAWVSLDEPEQERLRTYTLEDAAACWLVWHAFSLDWPEAERRLSLQTGEIEFRGIPVDHRRFTRDMDILRSAHSQALKRIPWFGQKDPETGKDFPLRSRKALVAECVRCGVRPPTTTSLKSQEFLDWLDHHGDRVPAIVDLVRCRRIERTLSAYSALYWRVRPDGHAAIPLKYFGAEKTGRWSGVGGFNLQNILRVPLYFDLNKEWLEVPPPAGNGHAIDLRGVFTASEGRQLVIADLSQIEPRVLAWLTGDEPFLNHLRGSLAALSEPRDPLSPYEAHARASMGYTGPTPMKRHAPALYALAKARVLALGYGAGWLKFIAMARGYCENEAQFRALFAVEPPPGQRDRFHHYLCGLPASPPSATSPSLALTWEQLPHDDQNIWVNAWRQVAEFRRTNPRLAHARDGLWARLERDFQSCHRSGEYALPLRSGRELKYFQVSPGDGGGWHSRPGHLAAPPSRTYGGLLCENLVQATARDVFAHGLLNLEKAGYRVLFHVHDEVIVDAPVDADPAEIAHLLCAAPAWCAGLPVASEVEVSTHYKK